MAPVYFSQKITKFRFTDLKWFLSSIRKSQTKKVLCLLFSVFERFIHMKYSLSWSTFWKILKVIASIVPVFPPSGSPQFCFITCQTKFLLLISLLFCPLLNICAIYVIYNIIYIYIYIYIANTSHYHPRTLLNYFSFSAYFQKLCLFNFLQPAVWNNLKGQSCKLYYDKYMIASTQITNTEIFPFIAVLVFK